jgi:hypothetical protein
MTQLSLISKLAWHTMRGNKSRQQQLWLRTMICALLQAPSKLAAGAAFGELRKGIKYVRALRELRLFGSISIDGRVKTSMHTRPASMVFSRQNLCSQLLSM